MEGASRSINNIARDILPLKAHYLSLSATRRYKPPPDADKKIEEKEFRPLQYTTFLSDADRGVLLTRAYFDVREDPISPNSTTNAAARMDPTKPKKKVSLKDYKNRKIEEESPDKVDVQPPRLATIKEKESIKKAAPSTAAKEMAPSREEKKAAPNAKPEPRRQRTPSPERKKRVADTDENSRPVKRNKIETATPSSVSRPTKESTAQKPGRPPPQDKPRTKDLKPPPTINSRSALNALSSHTASPKPSSQVNGVSKPTAKNHDPQKKPEKESKPEKTVPPLLSPTLHADVSELIQDGVKSARPSPKKKIADSNNSKLQPPKKSRDEQKPSPSPKKRKLPPLLSPTLPPVVVEELARLEKKGPEDSQKSTQGSDTSVNMKKAVKAKRREETIYVDSNKQETKDEPAKDEPVKEEPESMMVFLKYKKRIAKTIERLLALPPGGKKKSEATKKDERAIRDRSDSLEPTIARKRPRMTTDTAEATKRPKMSESLRPSTPPKQSAAMTRVASNSSQAGTPGASNSLTPAAAQPPERQRPVVDPDKLRRSQKLHEKHKAFMELGTILKHERDDIINHSSQNASEKERYVARAAGTQSLLSYMHALKQQSDAFDLTSTPRRPQSWKEVLPLFRVVRHDCASHPALKALVLRIHCIFLGYLGQALWFYPPDWTIAKDLIVYNREQQETWRLADRARRSLGVNDGSSVSSDGGAVGKLIDRLGPWTTPEEAIPIALEVLRKVIRVDGPWKPAEELTRIIPSLPNGASN